MPHDADATETFLMDILADDTGPHERGRDVDQILSP